MEELELHFGMFGTVCDGAALIIIKEISLTTVGEVSLYVLNGMRALVYFKSGPKKMAIVVASSWTEKITTAIMSQATAVG